MATLLHLDSSIWPTEVSVSRAVTAAFRTAWQDQDPEGIVIYRDLAAEPVPHLTAPGASAAYVDPTTHSPEQRTAFAARLTLADELDQADVVLIGAPMFNFTVPATLKAWLDNVIVQGRNAGDPQIQTASGTPVVVVASRGGSYAPGTPRDGFEYVQTYLESVLTDMLGAQVEFIVPELTMAHAVPAMADLVPIAEASRISSLRIAAERARNLAANFSAGTSLSA